MSGINRLRNAPKSWKGGDGRRRVTVMVMVGTELWSHGDGRNRDAGTPEIDLSAASTSWAETQLEEIGAVGTCRGLCCIQCSSHFFSPSFFSLKKNNFIFNFSLRWFYIV